VPIKISTDDAARSEVAWLCNDDWRLSSQISELQTWLVQNGAGLPEGRYTADVGFSPRADAAGGGGAIPPEMMRTMADLSMTLFLSEYPVIQDDVLRATRKT
jgi:hypothetical protein